MEKYSKYKDSGIEWIGEIPEEWTVARLRYRGKSIIGITYKPDEVSDEANGTLVLRSSNVQNGKLDFKDCVYVNKKIQKSQLTREGDILVCARNGSAHLVGKSAYIPKEWENVSFGAFMSIVRTDLDKFLFYYFNSQVFKGQKGLFVTSTINQLTSSMLNNLDIPIPPTKKEQTAIANYLDQKTAELDHLISEKKQLVKLYKEEKTAIINQAVTKGINPKAKLKDSGIEWLGDIPEHWEVKKLKYLGAIKYGLGQPPKQKIGGLPIIRATNVYRGKIDKKNLIFVDPDDIPYERDPILKEFDIIVVRSGAYTADSAIIPLEFNGAVTGYDMVFRAYDTKTAQFVAICLLSDYILKSQLLPESLRAAQPHLNREELGETLVAIPSNVSEQCQIVDFIEKEHYYINAKIKKAEKYINLLAEYRTSLISEVVTGKIKVIES